MSDEERTVFEDAGQTWSLVWHATQEPPPGTSNGSSGVCLTEDGGVVLVSEDGERWDLPGGRPEPGETLEEILSREIREEACAEILEARLLGFARGECLAGREQGKVLVRAFWLARVTLGPFEPELVIKHRWVVRPGELLAHTPPAYAPVYRRMLAAAGVAAETFIN